MTPSQTWILVLVDVHQLDKLDLVVFPRSVAIPALPTGGSHHPLVATCSLTLWTPVYLWRSPKHFAEMSLFQVRSAG